MEGWNNPLPIGRSIRDLTLKKQPGLGSGGKKVSPVAGAGRGHSSETRSPQTTHTYSAVRLHEHQITTLPTIRFLHIAFFITHPPPLLPPHAPTLPPWDSSAATISHGRGSGHLTQSLRQWNNSKAELAVCNMFPFVFLLALLTLFSSSLFLSSLSIYLQYTRQLWKIGSRIKISGGNSVMIFLIKPALFYCFYAKIFCYIHE